MSTKPILLSLVLLLLSPSVSHPQLTSLWGTLEAGPYAVGYTTLNSSDLTRPSVPINTLTARKGRQMQISVWYPARTGRRPSYMRFEEYVFLHTSELVSGPVSIEKRAKSVEHFSAELNVKASTSDLEKLLKLETRTVRNAQPPKRRFPLVVFAHSSPAFQSVMSEYLASHGFVVAAVPSKGSFEYEFDVALSGLETLIKDIEFVVSEIGRLDHVDRRQLGLIGMSFGSAAVVGFNTRHPELKAMISLDGGIGEGGVSYMVSRTPYFDIARVRSPLLHLFTPENPNLNLESIESYKYSTRYLGRIPTMRHGDFVAFSRLKQFIQGQTDSAVRGGSEGFDWVCKYSLKFLSAYLRDDAQALAFLQQPAPTNLITVNTLNKLPEPPTSRDLKSILESGDTRSLVSLFNSRKAVDPQPFSKSSLVEVVDWLINRRQYAPAAEVAKLFVESYPQSVRANYALALANEQLGNRELSQRYFREALRLINDDPDLDFRPRKRIEQAANQALKRLAP